MSFFADLTTHTYSYREPEEGVLNIGWLGEGNVFPTGNTTPEFVSALEALCSKPVLLHRGFHLCEYCEQEIGNGPDPSV